MIRLLFGDDGVGISDDVRKNIFDPFVTGDESRKSGKGSGLGLAISKKIVEAHGGFIHLRGRSETDHSTEYEILLPVEG
ncbi:histidine kinase [Lachnospiraceae bacterium JC7]|nr:histidine kinase [Lachnospiraceae bacterium JC7]